MSKSLVEWAKGNGTRPPIVTCAAWKGGDGKSTTARELAYLLDAVLVDLDWDAGCSSRSMGYRHENYVRSPLRDGFTKGRTPTPISGRRKADLVPSYPDLVEEQPHRDEVTDALERWARDWNRPVVVDTHPGGCEATYGAVNAADTVVVPAVMVKESLNALEGMVDELTDYPLLITPNKVDSPPQWARRRLAEIVKRHDIPMGPLVYDEPWIRKRTINIAISSEPVAKRARRFVDSMDGLVKAVINYA
ncbi:ParA family protein [Streptomyces sp. PKU-EA00015]|uniref:ParA family protein n=1 Tax=Streptomyces sp. PKU-EA00015 TaxID=2748326 RepID=UPI0015A36F52|nr:ParA family protein [Streptomyces sp. PKU-EA00015]NWF30879.1 ParA family protein [Streptomyces sp. PKU-EA00015]